MVWKFTGTKCPMGQFSALKVSGLKIIERQKPSAENGARLVYIYPRLVDHALKSVNLPLYTLATIGNVAKQMIGAQHCAPPGPMTMRRDWRKAKAGVRRSISRPTSRAWFSFQRQSADEMYDQQIAYLSSNQRRTHMVRFLCCFAVKK